MAQTAPTGAWNYETSDQYLLEGGALASDGTYLYTVGGYQDYYYGGMGYPQYYQQIRQYDPVANSWKDLSSMAQIDYWAGLTSTCVAFYNGSIYAFGNEWTGTGEIYEYNIAGDSWTLLSDRLTNDRFHAACAVVGTQIYIVGGYSYNFGPEASVDRFDPSTKAITPVASMDDQRQLPQAVYLSSTGKMYVAGGYNWNVGDVAGTAEYDPILDSWTNRQAMTFSVYGGGAVSLQNRMYVFGGYNNNWGYTNQTWEYSPYTNQWVRRDDMQYPRYRTGAATVGNRAYMYGGDGSTGADGEEFTPPNFGTAPFPAGGFTMSGSVSALMAQGDWTDAGISFSANVTDPDLGQQVRLEVQVKPAAAAWGTQTIYSSGNGSQGTLTIDYTIPTDGGYDVRYRVADAYDNYTPSVGGVPSWTEFDGNTVSPDFQSDQVPSSIPNGISPNGDDVLVPSLISGDVGFTWSASTDNGPTSALHYQIQVATDPLFGAGQIVASQSNIVPTSAVLHLAVDKDPYYWRVGTYDIGGNFSGWSTIKGFRVVGDDGLNHGSGDAAKCGFGAPGATGSALALLTLALAFAFRRK